ncbi:MAG: AraC family transcriptional regulator [Ruminococcaceae bacterium]|nr:AraC family transcriptional regulator [Oscillospiraceae bacterium]
MRYFGNLQEQYAQFRFKEHLNAYGNNRTLFIPTHIHRSAEILYVLSGKITLNVATREPETISAGEAALLFPYQPHSYDREDRTEYYRFNFSSSLAKSFFKSNSTLVGERSVFKVDEENLEPIIKRIHARQKISELKIKGFIYSFLSDFKDQITLCEQAASDDIFSKAILFMNENKGSDITIDDVAKGVGCCQKNLSRAINGIAKTNFTSLLSTLRVDNAIPLLLETDMTVLDIALQCGFGSERNFYRHFKKNTGLSPNEYRMRKDFVVSVDICLF